MQKKSPRHLSRSLAVQAIYYNKFNCTPIIEIERFLNENNNTVYNSADYDLMHLLIHLSLLNLDNIYRMNYKNDQTLTCIRYQKTKFLLSLV